MGIKPKLPTHYFINAEDGLELPSILLLEQLRTMDKRRLNTYIGHLREEHINGMNHALAISIDLIQTAPPALVMCPCNVCAENFRNTDAYFLRRIDPSQSERDTCTYCKRRKGFDYEARGGHKEKPKNA